MVRVEGVEPTCRFRPGILSPVRIPFRHTRPSISVYHLPLIELGDGKLPGNHDVADLLCHQAPAVCCRYESAE